MRYSMLKTAAVSPRVTVANPDKNAEVILSEIRKAAQEGAKIIVFPELCLCGYTCGDLFAQDALIAGCENALSRILCETKDLDAAVALGLPVRGRYALYNCAVMIQKGKILGAVIKNYIPNYKEFYEKRWFASGLSAPETSLSLCGKTVPCGELLFSFGEEIRVGMEICEDLWVPVPPSSALCLAGANLIVNLSASNEIVTKHDYRRSLILQQSGRCICGYLFASAGVGESSTDLVFSGDCVVAENGSLLGEGKRFAFDGSSAEGVIDFGRLEAERRNNTSFFDNSQRYAANVTVIAGSPFEEVEDEKLNRFVDPHPFVPSNPVTRDERCREIFALQANGLAKRLSHTGLHKAVVGISGGLDSTLALLVSVEAMKILKLPTENVRCVTMPGFGTTGRTYHNAVELVTSLGASLSEIDIRPACLQHMKDIGHDPDIHDVTYENTQARERTQILMDLANKEGAILVGTGDLSELAMGWCTYNGDHMSMYGVNASVPKTLVRHLCAYVAASSEERIRAVLLDILDTPVSPELLPPDENGKIAQKTEDNIGPYELHDFFLYYFVRFGFLKEKILFLAKKAFGDRYSEEEIQKWLSVFLKRFFMSQFKRSCLPDGPKVGSVSLSPRGDFRMPSDADGSVWQL